MNKRLKILYVLDNLGFGGVERNTINIANLLAESHNVSLLVLTSNSLDMKQFISDKVSYYNLESKRVFPSIFKLIKFLKKHKFDSIITAKEYVNVTCLFSRIFSKDIKKIITSTRTYVSSEKIYSKLKLSDFYLLLAKILYKFAKANVCVSQGVANDLKKNLNLKRNPVVIYNPAAKESSFTLQPKIPHPWFEEEIPVIIGCGRLTKQKDFSLLINAFSEVIKKKEARLVILGEGELRPQLEKQIKDLGLKNKVLLPGNVNSPESYMYHAKVFALSSLWEGFGNVIVEALSVGCPVISMNCPSGPSEILEDGKWGTLVTERKFEKLAEAITAELEREKPKKEYLQKRAKDFTPERIAEEYLKLIKK